MIYVVLGMHKSGTTLVSQMLHKSGINMGDFADIDGNIGYDSGHKYERRISQNINRSILAEILKAPPDIKSKNFQGIKYDRAGYLMNDDAVAIVQQSKLDAALLRRPERAEIRTMINDCNARYENWGFKDPRTCLTYPLWQEELPTHKLIVVYRGFTPLFKRMLRMRRHRIPILNLPRIYGILHAWTVHNSRILMYANAATTPVIFLNYDDLMKEHTDFDRLCEFVGRTLVDMRNPILYRNRTKSPTYLPPLARLLVPFLPISPQRVYDELNHMSKNP